MPDELNKPLLENSFSLRMGFISNLVGNATKLADKAGISRRTIGLYLSGKTDPTRKKLISLAKAAGVRVDWLATGQPPIYNGPREERSTKTASGEPLVPVGEELGGNAQQPSIADKIFSVSLDKPSGEKPGEDQVETMINQFSAAAREVCLRDPQITQWLWVELRALLKRLAALE